MTRHSRTRMPHLPRSLARPGGIPLVAALLCLTFGAAGTLAFEAWRATRIGRATAARALQEYTAYGAWSTMRHVEATLYVAMTALLRGAAESRVGEPDAAPPLSILTDAAAFVRHCRCAAPLPADLYFRADLRRRTLETSDGSAATARRYAWLVDSVAAHGDRYRQMHALFFARVGDSTKAVAYSARRGLHGEPLVGYGLVADAAAVGMVAFTRRPGSDPIVPRSVTRGVAEDSLIVVEARAPDGSVIYRSPHWEAPTVSDTESLSSAFGPMLIRVGLRPGAAARLPVGSAPPSHVPLWLALLALAGVAAAAAVQHLRREHALARSRASFAAGVSHELRTPLAQILLYGETLIFDRARSEHARRNAAEVIVREARRLMRMVENALHFTRAERRLVELRRERVYLAGVVREVTETFAPLAWAAGARLRDELDDAAVADVDREALRQILLNLLDNAVKYGPRGQTVAVRLTTAGDAVRLAVDDEGPGVAAADRARIWEPFARGVAPAATAAPSGGAGIGLAVVRDLTARHGGRAWVEDAPGGGARFVVELPTPTADRGLRTADSPPPREELEAGEPSVSRQQSAVTSPQSSS